MPVSLSIKPANLTLLVKDTRQFKAILKYSNNSTEDITMRVTWNSSNSNVAIITSTGMASSVSSGSSTITARYSGISAECRLTVTEPAAKLARTGQNLTYAVGDDGFLQMGVVWPDPRFIIPDNTINGPLMLDQLTGLMWTNDTSSPGPAVCGPNLKKTWSEALKYVACLNSNSYLNYSDWRLPNINELRSLIDFGKSSSDESLLWSSTVDTTHPERVWSMIGSVVSPSDFMFVKHYVRPVRTDIYASLAALPKTGQTICYDPEGSKLVVPCAGTGEDGETQSGVAWPSPRFIDNANGTISDFLTGLIWPKDANTPGPEACAPNEKKSWQSALEYVSCLNINSYLGYSDWRLPNIIELFSIVNQAASSQSDWLIAQGFSGVQSLAYISSTTDAVAVAPFAWSVSMINGNVGPTDKPYSVDVWPVRGGQ